MYETFLLWCFVLSCVTHTRRYSWWCWVLLAVLSLTGKTHHYQEHPWRCLAQLWMKSQKLKCFMGYGHTTWMIHQVCHPVVKHSLCDNMSVKWKNFWTGCIPGYHLTHFCYYCTMQQESNFTFLGILFSIQKYETSVILSSYMEFSFRVFFMFIIFSECIWRNSYRSSNMLVIAIIIIWCSCINVNVLQKPIFTKYSRSY